MDKHDGHAPAIVDHRGTTPPPGGGKLSCKKDGDGFLGVKIVVLVPLRVLSRGAVAVPWTVVSRKYDRR